MHTTAINFSLRKKLLTAYFIGAAIIIVVGTFSYLHLETALSSYRQDVRIMQSHATAVLHIQSQFKVQVQEWKNVLLRGKDSQKLEKYWKGFKDKESEVNQDALDLAAALPISKAKQKLEQFITSHQQMAKGYRQGFDAFTKADADPYSGDKAVTGIDREATELLNEVEKEVTQLANQASAKADEEAEQGSIYAFAALLITLSVGVISAYWIVRMLTKQLGGEPAYAVEAMTKIGHGNLDFDIELKDSDQSSLLYQLDHMRHQLHEVVDEVRQHAASVTEIALQISSSAQALSKAALEQALGIEKTSSSVEELNSSVQQNVEHAKNTNTIANRTAQDADNSGEAVSRTLNAMKNINGKIGLIEDISYKTNLLSLNASIEAARSGDQGKGFAVVAAEVRKLADNSHAAALDINQLTLDSLQIAEEAGNLLAQVVPNIQKTAELITKITESSSEQAIGISQINQAMTQLDRTTQQNAALSEQLASTAKEMSKQAEQLQRAVAYFN